MKRKAVAVIAVIAAVGIISVYLLTRPKALGNMSGSCSERTTETSDISFSGEAGGRIKFSFKSDIISGDLDIALYDSAGNEVYVLDRADELETFFTLERSDTYTLAAEYNDFIGTYEVFLYSLD
jgi:hypothetical protein